jgi:hypothetical protein
MYQVDKQLSNEFSKCQFFIPFRTYALYHSENYEFPTHIEPVSNTNEDIFFCKRFPFDTEKEM